MSRTTFFALIVLQLITLLHTYQMSSVRSTITSLQQRIEALENTDDGEEQEVYMDARR